MYIIVRKTCAHLQIGHKTVNEFVIDCVEIVVIDKNAPNAPGGCGLGLRGVGCGYGGMRRKGRHQARAECSLLRVRLARIWLGPPRRARPGFSGGLAAAHRDHARPFCAFTVAACRAEPTHALTAWGWENGMQVEPQVLYVMQWQSIDLWTVLADSSERCCIKRTSRIGWWEFYEDNALKRKEFFS